MASSISCAEANLPVPVNNRDRNEVSAKVNMGQPPAIAWNKRTSSPSCTRYSVHYRRGMMVWLTARAVSGAWW